MSQIIATFDDYLIAIWQKLYTDMIEVGKKIKALRTEKSWTQADIAKKLNITVAAFSKIETQVTDISLSRLEQLEVSLADLLGFSTAPSNVDEPNALKQAHEVIERQSAKINHLQEYVITLYERLHQTKPENS